MQQTLTGDRSALLSYLSLFTSFGTLLCCALPSLLVLLGLGATVASFLAAVPWLVWLSHHKQWVFVTAGLLIAANLYYSYSLAPRMGMSGGACPPGDASACVMARRFGRIVLWVSVTIYAIGVCSAYLLGPLLMRFAG